MCDGHEQRPYPHPYPAKPIPLTATYPDEVVNETVVEVQVSVTSGCLDLDVLAYGCAPKS
jgi:hypothetical protein